MILIFKTIHGEKVVTQDWTAEAHNNKECTEISYLSPVSRVRTYEVIQLDILIDTFIDRLQNVINTGLCDLSDVSHASNR